MPYFYLRCAVVFHCISPVNQPVFTELKLVTTNEKGCISLIFDLIVFLMILVWRGFIRFTRPD